MESQTKKKEDNQEELSIEFTRAKVQLKERLKADLEESDNTARSSDSISTIRRSAAEDSGDADLDQELDQSLLSIGIERRVLNLVVEMVYTHELLPQLVEKLNQWMRPHISAQVAIGIKIYPNSVRRRVILIRRGGGDLQEVEFEPCQAESATLTFPLSALYHGAPLPPVLTEVGDAKLRVDLAELGAEIDLVFAAARR